MVESTFGRCLLMDSYRDEDELLINALNWQKRPRVTTSKLGVSGNSYFSHNLRKMEKNAKIVDAWNELIPEGLEDHCRLKSIDSGVVELEVDAGPYMHELRLMTSELLEHLRERCGRGAVKRIKLVTR